MKSAGTTALQCCELFFNYFTVLLTGCSSFVDGDTDGITEIRKKTEEDSGLSGWSKLRIMNECSLALMDLGAENLLRQMERNPQGSH